MYRNKAGTVHWAIYIKKYSSSFTSREIHQQFATSDTLYKGDRIFSVVWKNPWLEPKRVTNYFFKYRSLLFYVFTYQLTTSLYCAHFSIYWQSDTYGIIKASLQVFYKTAWFEEKLSSFALKIDSKLSSFFFFVINYIQQVHESPEENYKIHSEAKTVVIYVILSEIFMSCSVIS